MEEFMKFIIGFILGGFIGIIIMCILIGGSNN